MPITPEVEVPPKPSSSAISDPKNVINIADDPIPTADSGKGASSSKHRPSINEISAKLQVLESEHESLQKSLKESHENETKIKNVLEDKRPSINEISAKLQVLESEHESLQKSLKESHENETKIKQELEDKHAQEMSEMAEKLKNNNNGVKTLASKLKVAEAEATDVDKMIFLPKATNVKNLLVETRRFDTLFANRVDHSSWYEKHDHLAGFAEDEEEDEEEGSGSSAHQSGEESGDESAKDNTYHASDEDKPESSE
ncbi:hypothetical protein QYE76_053113 [Lolium multiflorum]|uniref:Uncharacterized protein n=1 Tax=Lolium multiflorum TaxID=4521 RepID=A0AAD8PHN8_LOLMU|nr:hypothetical protein QYE76_027278 [Lolium multiflorum]KAK1664954.1 hypothetical protein QYE76_053113 [Lolium multiflorum]